ncbi:MAG: endonuclease/exonuclease/phosphatase family protein [Gammaproteobacteria bacterium]|nr:endonuclease/exonuclease/phosphatase family protein [Gammaproteobacteria bacterium]NND59966.1 hypothetical protein [Gammaproteobacteria bacterium]
MDRLGLVLTALLAFTALDSDAGVVGDEVRVLTRNVYVGADIFRVIEAPDPLLALTEIALVYDTVQQTDFPERAKALASEIAATQPHIVGLQEVALIRIQEPGDVLIGNPVAATEIDFDYLQLLLDELAVLGLQYSVAGTIDNADVELPLLGATLRDVRLTDRDVLLVRDDVIIGNAESGNFHDFVAFELSGLPIEFLRGFNAVDAWIAGRPYRIVNVHLETGGDFGAAVQQMQAAELLDSLSDQFLPLIVIGDFNAGPVSAPAQAYQQFIDAGYNDAWALYSNADGFTCCHSETLDDPASQLSSRIDLVMVRNPGAVIVTDAAVLGDEPADLTPNGLWPSDHAGVYAALALAVGDTDNDTIDDLSDNCVLVSNPTQHDTDNDGFGNLCDGDLDQSGFTNFADLAMLRQAFFSDDPDADFNGDGIVGFLDLAIFKSLFGAPPGPVSPAAPGTD